MAAQALSRGLSGLMEVDGGATAEQRRVFTALATHLLGQESTALAVLSPLGPDRLAEELVDPCWRRLFLQVAIILDLCRHPKSEAQLKNLEAYAEALQVDPPQLKIVRDFAHLSAVEATNRFVRLYENYMPELSENYRHQPGEGRQNYDDSFFEAVERLAEMPEGSLGWAFIQLYERNGMTVPSRSTPNPGYYVCHDMNHVITGYEPTGPGEIALGAFKLALNNSDANWMASLTNFLIHEVGLFKHGTNLQFIPYGGGGEPYHGVDGRCGALDLPGSPELLAEALVRGSACSGDFSQLDHLAIAAQPLREIRRQFHVLPLRRPMIDQPDLWPSSY
ncbi:ubiquinone biosynthesis protein COQ4 [Vulcanococcus limneticus]|uniref:ubiquinone biosynthesis protein COQ4 n=2 Tax=Vulcanococcus limneticus TaxID=2170428 RepID=UPI0020CF9026|nr:ubiquinone biosynthesis protein COQ4 [Vulcanococcus limneticus]